MSAMTNHSVNLLGREPFEHTTAGRLATWAITYGRYIMIATEVVVLIAFISRFTLDRKLTDLNDEITQKQQVLEANKDYELQIRNLQDKLTKLRPILDEQKVPSATLTTIQNILPHDVILEGIQISPTTVQVKAIAGSTSGFSQLIANLLVTKELREIEIGAIERSAISGLRFSFSAKIGTEVKVPKLTKEKS